MEEIIGSLTGIFTTIAAVPQIIKALKAKKVNGVSPIIFKILILGVYLWTTYGILKSDIPIIVINGISVILNTIMLLLIIKCRKSEIYEINGVNHSM